jgi:DNA-binding transcriptional LysR family regulator
VDTGGFTSAAEILPISRSGVSKHLSELETSLGGRLLHRTTRRISLTQAGKAYYEKCKQILEAVDEAEALVTGISGTPKGLLRINAPMSFGNKWMGPVLASFRKKHPDVEIDITLTDRQIDIVEEGYDATIRITRPSDSSLVARKISPCRFFLGAAPQYLKISGTPKTIEDLKHHNCLLYHYRPNRDLWAFQHHQKEVTVKVSGSRRENMRSSS